MGAAVANLVWETSTTTGTGDLTTSRNGGYQRGNEAFGTTDLTTSNPWIFIVNRDAAAAEWEMRQTYWSAAGTLKRTGAPTLSSNANAAVNFGAGTKDVMSDIPASLQKGDPVVSEILTAAAVNSPGSGTPFDVTSISVPAGKWRISGSVWTKPAGTTTTSFLICWTHTVSATNPTSPNKGSKTQLVAGVVAGTETGFPTGPQVVDLTATTTYYLGCSLGFAVSTMQAYGYIMAEPIS